VETHARHVFHPLLTWIRPSTAASTIRVTLSPSIPLIPALVNRKRAQKSGSFQADSAGRRDALRRTETAVSAVPNVGNVTLSGLAIKSTLRGASSEACPERSRRESVPGDGFFLKDAARSLGVRRHEKSGANPLRMTAKWVPTFGTAAAVFGHSPASAVQSHGLWRGGIL
jgi:hypothetical protein